MSSFKLSMPDLSKADYQSFMPTLIKIIGVILLLYIVGLILVTYIGMMRNYPILIKKETSTLNTITIPADKLPLSDVDGGLSWTFVSWLYIEDWNYRFGQKKAIMNWGDNMIMYFDEKSNDLHIDVLTLPSGKVETLVFKDVPLQRWFSLIVVLDGRNLDLFVDGQLVANKFLSEVPYYFSEILTLFQDGGFRGKIGYLQYMNSRIPQFGIVHFQGIKKKLTRNSLLWSLYSQFWFGITFGFKTNFQRAMTIINRRFKQLNFLSVDLFGAILGWIRSFLASMYDFLNRMIFRWA